MTNQMQPAGASELEKAPPKAGRRKKALIIAAIGVLAVVGIAAAVKYVFFPSSFTPVTLNPKEEKILTQKIQRLNKEPQARDSTQNAEGRTSAPNQQAPLRPEPYTEARDDREIAFTEKEFNALIARNTNLAERLAFDFSGDLASMKLLIPLDPNLPFFGGRTLRVNAGVELAYANDQPVVRIRGVSIWGVPLPNAWLGNLKNVDLVQQFGGKNGFWSAFAAGIEEIRVEEGRLRVRLRP